MTEQLDHHEWEERADPKRRRWFDVGGAKWILLLTLVLTVAAGAWQLRKVLHRLEHRNLLLQQGALSGDVTGTTQSAADMFDLSVCLVPQKQIYSGGPPKDGIPALTDPKIMAADEVANRRIVHGGKFMVGGDRVIGVNINGQARAYPIRMLNVHELVNDTLGGVPILVTYCPLCDSAVVFDRRVDGEVPTFGVSGLLYNSNVLMYDRQDDATQESLWSQLQARAVTGPAAAEGKTLEILPSAMTTWAMWRDTHPQTTILDPGNWLVYKDNPYAMYFGDDRVWFPANPMPPEDGPANKTQLIYVDTGQAQGLYSIHRIADKANDNGIYTTTLGETALRFVCTRKPTTVTVHADDDTELDVMYTFWFAWYAMYPEKTDILP